MKLFGILVIAAYLVGCASGPLSEKRDLESSSKQQGIELTCSGYKTWTDCNNAAAKACPQGYATLSKEENLVIQSRVLRIQCK